MTYKQLTQEQRYQIYAFMKAGFTQTQIAREISVHPSTVSREVRRNHGRRGYRPKQAQALAQDRKLIKQKTRISPDTWRSVERHLSEQWSPEQIHGHLKRGRQQSVSHEWIYQYIYRDKLSGGSLYRNLRGQKQRRKRYGTNQRRGQIPHRRPISERPAIVESRQRIGDWEIDTIIGKGHRQAIVSIVERRSRYCLLAKVERKTAAQVMQVSCRKLLPHKAQVRTITSDNGREFAAHQQIAESLEADFFFAHPYHSWERGTNENTNGLVRQYFPKRMPFASITDEQIQTVEAKLNSRPRKTLGYRTPNELFFKELNVALTN